VVINYHIFIW